MSETRAGSTTGVPPLWRRVLLMPFSPRLWVDARRWPVSAVVVPLFLSATLWSGGLATYRAIEFLDFLEQAATRWDSNFDPLIIENGEARVEGTRLPENADPKSLMLADPEETRPPPTDRRYMIVRKHSVIRSNGRPVDLQVIEQLAGGSIRLDSASILAWLEAHRRTVQLGLFSMIVALEWLGTIAGLIYGVLGGAALLAIAGKTRGLTSAECTHVAIASLAVKPVISTALAALGSGVNACLGVMVWPALCVVLALLALKLERSRATEA